MRRLYWFQNNLRLQDHPGLLAQSDAEQLLLVYLWPKNRPWCNLTGIGPQRERFLVESLQALRDKLAELGQSLMILEGSPELVIPELVREYGIERVDTSRTPGYYERRSLELLTERLSVPVTVHRGDTLFAEDDLPFSLTDLPGQFTPFRKRIDDVAFSPPVAAPTSVEFSTSTVPLKTRRFCDVLCSVEDSTRVVSVLLIWTPPALPSAVTPRRLAEPPSSRKPQ